MTTSMYLTLFWGSQFVVMYLIPFDGNPLNLLAMSIPVGVIPTLILIIDWGLGRVERGQSWRERRPYQTVLVWILTCGVMMYVQGIYQMFASVFR